jgi:hypothetical protein
LTERRSASDDIPQHVDVKAVLQDLMDVRYAKARRDLRSIDASTGHLMVRPAGRRALLLKTHFRGAAEQLDTAGDQRAAAILQHCHEHVC